MAFVVETIIFMLIIVQKSDLAEFIVCFYQKLNISRKKLIHTLISKTQLHADKFTLHIMLRKKGLQRVSNEPAAVIIFNTKPHPLAHKSHKTQSTNTIPLNFIDRYSRCCRSNVVHRERCHWLSR